MSDLITRTAKLVPYNKRPRQVPSFVTAYSYEPLPDEPGAQLGSLYVVAEVLVSGRASEEVADLVIETLGEHYYNQPADPSTPLTRFEGAIKAVNHALAQYVSGGNAAWIGKLSAIVAIQAGKDLHVASTGSAEGFLYRGKASTHITGNEGSRPVTPAKTFGSIASGELEPGDRLLLATPALTHQIQLSRLKSLISSSNPSVAIAELTEILRGASTDRIAALVIEATTPEIAALQVRSEEPSEIHLGSPENAIEAVKIAAEPLKQSTVDTSRQVAVAAVSSWDRLRPHLRRLGLGWAAALRKLLASKKRRRLMLGAVALLVVLIAAAIWAGQHSASGSANVKQFQEAYAQVQQADAQLSAGDKSGAHELLKSAQRSLETLKDDQAKIDAQLRRANLATGVPRSVAELTTLVDDQLDQVNGLVKIDPVTVVIFNAKNAKPQHFEVNSSKAYIIDAANKNQISIINLTNKTQTGSKTDTSKLGDVKATTLSTANDGMYILTAEPAVWFYRFDTDSLARQSVGLSDWPNAAAIGSYASNLYLLGPDMIYKHQRTSTGFSPRSNYLVAGSDSVAGASALAVDGAVYALKPGGLERYIAGTLKQTAEVPDKLAGASDLRSYANGEVIIATADQTRRIGVWAATDNDMNLTKQVGLNGVKALYDTSYVVSTGTAYALVDGRLVSFPL